MGFVKGGGSGSGAPSGPAGGDLAGTFPNPTVSNVSILTTTGDLLYESSTGVSSRRAIGTTGQVLTVTGGVPVWATPSSAPVSSVFTRTGAVVAATNDYTDAQIQNSPTNVLTTTGDLLYASAANTLARLAVGSNGQVLTLASGIPSWATPGTGGGGEIGYDQITSPVVVSSAIEATGTAIITCAAHTFDGAPVVVEFFTPELYFGSAQGNVYVCLFESTTQIGRLLRVLQNTLAAAGDVIPVVGKLRFTPSAGSHTYTVTAFCTNGGSPQIGAGAGGTATDVPAYCRFTKV